MSFAPERHGRYRRGFTLVEMLVVVAIIGMLAGLAMAALYGSQQSARASRTKSTITKLHQALATRWESYRTRRLPIALDTPITVPANPPPINVRELAIAQLIARRELMRMELPDRWADVAWSSFYSATQQAPYIPSGYSPTPETLRRTQWTPIYGGSQINWQTEARYTTVPSPFDGSTLQMPQSALSLSYLRRYQQIAQQTGGTPPSLTYEGAECLYMIMTSSMGDESSSDLMISKRDIGDVDHDGAPEFLDGWGNPIDFVRWAPGIYSDLQPQSATNPNPLDPISGHDPTNYHDPFDPLKVDPLAFEMFPLISSAGADGVYGYQVGNPYDFNDPYSYITLPSGAYTWHGQILQLPSDGGGSMADNITNHLLDIRK